jgi:hypothetical protein
MTSLYFSFRVRLTRLRHSGELLSRDYGRGIGPSEYRKVLADLFPPTNRREVNHRLKNLLISKRLYAAESCQ